MHQGFEFEGSTVVDETAVCESIVRCIVITEVEVDQCGADHI